MANIISIGGGGKKPQFTTQTVVPSDYAKIVTKDTILCEAKDFSPIISRGTGGSNFGTSFSPSTTLVQNKQYRITGRVDIVDEQSVLEYYNINAIITWGASSSSNEAKIYTEFNSTNYLRSLTFYRYNNTNFRVGYSVQIAGRYGINANLAVCEITDYDGLSSVMVEPVPDTYYSPDLLYNLISRSSNFTSIKWPEQLANNGTIGEGIFQGCTYFNPPNLPEGVKYIRANAFYNCYAITWTSLPSSITNIYSYAFYHCINLALTSLPSGLTRIESNTFYQCTNLPLTSLPSGLTGIGSYAFYYCPNLALTNLPSTLTSIESYAFCRCTNLALTSLPSTLTSIGQYAFSSCTRLTTISSTAAITYLGAGAFLGGTDYEMQLTSASFPNANISSLGTAFGHSTAANACQHLAFVDLGSTQKIEGNAFYNCYALRTLILRRTSAICALSNVSAFTNTPLRGYNSLTATVYVPSALIATYRTAANWSSLYSAGTVNFVAIEGSTYE